MTDDLKMRVEKVFRRVPKGAYLVPNESLIKDLYAENQSLKDQCNDLAAANQVCDVNIKKLEKENEALRDSKNYAYYERNQLVGALTKIFPAWRETHPDTDTTWDNDWRNIIFISLPTGQVSWHIHDSELHNFQHLPQSAKEVQSWDGHTNEDKYERLSRLEQTLVAKGGEDVNND